MKWLDIFIGKQTPERIAGVFKALTTFQILMYLFHFQQTFRTWDGKWSWSGEINHWQFDPNRTWNKRFQFADSVEATYKKLDLKFTFASFQEWLNVYTVSFLIADLLKLAISIFVFWQLSKAIANRSVWGFQPNESERHFPNTSAVKGDFKGFTTEGVKRLRLAALPIMLIPLLNYFAEYIFILYAGTQSSFAGFQKYPSALMISEPGEWLYYLYATLIILGTSEIFRYGQQLKEETELTV